jgi:uncharacterized cupredoxin-like copper-binding protein
MHDHHDPNERRRWRPVVAGAALALIAAACGGDDTDNEAGLGPDAGEPRDAGPRTVEVAMTDNEFSPSQIEVAPDETVRLVFDNEGAVTHDAVVGDEAAQREHEEEMRAPDAGSHGGEATGDMSHGTEADGDEAGGDEAAITVEPGETGELEHTFAADEEVLIGCHEPGHYEAGMTIDVTVSDA